MSTWKPDRPSRAEIEPRPVADSLGRMARRLGSPGVDVMGAVCGRWTELVGEVVADHARPLTLTRGVLTVGADSPAWATQLRLLSGDLLARVAEVPGAAEAVREVRVVVRPDQAGR